MSCVTGVIDRFYFVRWKKPELQDVSQIVRDVASVRQTVEKPLVYVAIAPEDSTPPDDQVRKAMLDAMEEMLGHCETMHFVFEGSGFGNVVKRSALAGILLVKGKRGRVFVHESVEAALASVAGSLKIDPGTILRAARVRGLVT